MKPNILMITVDDMNYDSPDFMRDDTIEITPHINKLREESCYFSQAHVNVAVCQPARQCIMTGKLPHNNGSHGFQPIAESTVTLQEILKTQGYINGTIGKIKHLAPLHKYCWDEYLDVFIEEYHWGRNPDSYYDFCTSFFQNREVDGAPFFLMANSHDPHRPLAGSQHELNSYGFHVPVTRTITEEEIDVPGFLPDVPEVRKEVAQYYTSVHRGDQTVGMILKALDESPYADNTIVIFLSDNGMAFPFAKTNCYLNSTRTPLLIRWPNMVKQNSTDLDHLVSGVDIMPTILDIMDIDYDETEYDGRSFHRLLQGKEMDQFHHVFTLFNANSAKQVYEMRCIQDKEYGYIYNDWSDGTTRFNNESMYGLTFNAMQNEAKQDDFVAERVNKFLFRKSEEFYDYQDDPNALRDLMTQEKYQDKISIMKNMLREKMENSNDPLLGQCKL